jgi:MinD-like ATPase involved in chromosome partitioning or flagellar assembly
VLNRAGVRGGVDEAACAKQLGEPIAAALPDDPALATFALNRGVPFVLSHPRSILSRKMLELTEKVFELRAGDVVRRSETRMTFGKPKARTVQQAVAG